MGLDSIPKTRVARWGRTLTIALGAVAAITVAVSALFLVLENRELRRSNECRFDIATEKDAVKDKIDIAVARIVEASVLLEQPGTSPAERDRLQRLIPHEASQIRIYVRELLPLAERRLRVNEICSQ